MINIASIVLELIKYGLGNSKNCEIPADINWDEVLSFATTHGVDAIVFDCIKRCHDEGIPININDLTKFEWIGTACQQEATYEIQKRTIASLAKFYAENGIRLMVLKGQGLSFNYPVPSHRQSCDLDIWCFGKWREANNLIAMKSIKIDNSHHTHSVFQIDGVTIENHYNFISKYQRYSNRIVERKLQELARKDVVEKDGVFYPSADFNAIHVLRHCAGDFSSTQMTLRQVLDWGLLMERHQREIHWDEYLPFIDEIGMRRFFNLMNIVCVKHLGFPIACFQNIDEDEVEEQFLMEILNPDISIREDGTLLSGLTRKSMRWLKNSWKRNLCYSENDVFTFMYDFWGKILKPRHFIH